MENTKNNGHLADSLRRKLENFPEEIPSESDWQEVRGRMLSEGLLRKKSYRKRYLLLLLLILGISGYVILPFWIKRENNVVTKGTPRTKTEIAEKNKAVENEVSKKDELVKNEKTKTTDEDKTTQKTGTDKPGGEKSSYPLVEGSPEQKNNIQHSRKNSSEQPEGVSANIEAENQDEKNTDEGSTSVEAGSGISSEIKLKTVPEEETIHPSSENTSVTAITPPAIDTSSAKNIPENVDAGIDSVSATQPVAVENDSTPTNIASENKTESENVSRRKLRLGFFVSWDRNRYYLKGSDNAERTESDYILDSDSINGKKSAGQFTLGIRADYLIGKKIELEAGVFYSQKRKIDAVIYTPKYSSPSAGESVSDYIYHFNARYFEMDGRLKYYVYHQNPSVYISAGVRGSLNLTQGTTDYFEHTIYSESAVPRTERVLLKPTSMGLSLVVAAGLELPLNPRCNFFFEPSYTHALDPVIDNPDYIIVPVNHFRRSISIGTGLNYSF